jgi:uncharacterized protein
MNTDILGKGIAFPLQLNSRGGIKDSSQAQKIKESMLMIIGTQYGERLMRPNFGCNLKSLLFAVNNQETANLARHYVQEGLTTWEPRIILEDVTVTNNYKNHTLLIKVSYRIKSTYEAQNLVYPFYLEQP